jgi:signal transduction histidine kinase
MGVSLLLKALESAAGAINKPGRVREARSLLDQVINHTHNLAHAFSSMDENGADLPSLFRKLTLTVKKTFHISCRLSLPAGLPQIPAEVTLQLYKIALESVSNAIRHAKATVVTISITCDQGRLTMQIKNDGVPFPLYEEPGNRLGMRIMNYRAHTIDAELDVRPNGDSGTVVTCSWAGSAGRACATPKPGPAVTAQRIRPDSLKDAAIAALS